jgi:taurine dioxygenase
MPLSLTLPDPAPRLAEGVMKSAGEVAGMTTPTLTITPLDPVGAEVTGLEGVTAYDAELARALNRAWADFGVLVFRGVASAEQHLALSRCFGEIEVHPMPELRDRENPFFFPLGGERVHAMVFDETDVIVNRIPWHRDTAYMPSMCMGAVLRMLEVPDRGGETLLGDTAAAYDDLPADLRQRLDGLEMLVNPSNGVIDRPKLGTWWTTVREARDDEYPAGVVPFHVKPGQAPDKSKFPATILPAVFVHPESGRKCLFISPMNAECFLDMDRKESDDLLAFLVAHMTDPRYVYRHRWRVNDAVIWDNRRFVHAAYGNPLGEKRRGLRTTLATRFLVGRYADGAVGPAAAAAM